MSRWKQRFARYGLIGLEDPDRALELVTQGLREGGDDDEDFIQLFEEGWGHALSRLSESDDPDETRAAFQSEAMDMYPCDPGAAGDIYEGMLAAFWFRDMAFDVVRVEVRRISDGKVFSSICKSDLAEDDLRELLLQAGLEESMVSGALLAGGAVGFDLEWSVRTGGGF